MNRPPLRQLRKKLSHDGGVTHKQGNLIELCQAQQPRAQAVIDVVVVVRDLVGEICDLRFERRLVTRDKTLAKFAQLACVLKRAMLENSFACLERKVEPVEPAIAL